MFMTNNTGAVDMQCLNNRTESPDLTVQTSINMLVLYREEQEYDIYRWDSVSYVMYASLDGAGIFVNESDELEFHFEDDTNAHILDTSAADAYALAQYGSSNWEMSDYHTNVLGKKETDSITVLWREILGDILGKLPPYSDDEGDVDSYVRSKAYHIKEFTKPWLGLGGTKYSDIDFDAHAELISPDKIPEHEWSGTSLRFRMSDGTWGGYVDLSGLTGAKGDKPDHQWSGTSLRFQNPDGTWGVYVDLKGVAGSGGSLIHINKNTNFGYSSLPTSQFTQLSQTIATSGYYMISTYMTCYAFGTIPWVEAAVYDGSNLIAHGTACINTSGTQTWCTAACTTLRYLNAGTVLALKSKSSLSGVTRGFADLSAVKVA